MGDYEPTTRPGGILDIVQTWGTNIMELQMKHALPCAALKNDE